MVDVPRSLTGLSAHAKQPVAIISKALFFLTFFTLLIFIVIHVHVHMQNFFMEMRALSTMQHAHLKKRHVMLCWKYFLAFHVSIEKRKKIDCIAYSDASVIVIKSRKSKGYAIADTDCKWNLWDF